MPTRLLAGEGHDVTVFFANSNIAPRTEYEKRLGELARYAGDQGFHVIEGDYDPGAWEREVAPIGEAIRDFSPALGARHRGGDGDGAASGEEAPQTVAELLDDERRRERCRACYRLRLEEAAAAAAAGGFDALSTTLAVSPYQFTDVIREELERAAAGAGIEPLFEDYRPYYNEATRISRELGMYRQNYCGCRFSVAEGEATRAFIKRQRAEAKAVRAAEREAEEVVLRERAAEKRAYAEERARRRAILKSMRENE